MVRRLFDLTAAEASLASPRHGLTLEEARRQLESAKIPRALNLRSIFRKSITRQTTLGRTLLSSVIWMG